MSGDSVNLPDELAPTLRAAAERLLSEVEVHDGNKPLTPRPKKNRCWRCGGVGPLALHHLDNGKVVMVHKKCHRKLHKKR